MRGKDGVISEGEIKGRGSLILMLEAQLLEDYPLGGGTALIDKTEFLEDIIMVGLYHSYFEPENESEEFWLCHQNLNSYIEEKPLFC